MNEIEAIQKMVPPGQPRPQVTWKQGVLQIWITRSCDKSCFGCTQGSNLKGPFAKITLDQFDDACASLHGYFGVIGMFGGNPAVHPQFVILTRSNAGYGVTNCLATVRRHEKLLIPRIQI